jgi:peptide deformylase
MRREILVYPDPFLARKAVSVAVVDDRIRALVRDMFETMYAAEGVGLAATQVGVGKRVIVLDVSPVDETISPLAVVNPEIVWREGSVTGVEGCLSVPGIQGEVCRAETVDVRGMDERGNPLRIRATGILSRALQHEIDHLDGVLFIDRASSSSPSSAAASAK